MDPPFEFWKPCNWLLADDFKLRMAVLVSELSVIACNWGTLQRSADIPKMSYGLVASFIQVAHSMSLLCRTLGIFRESVLQKAAPTPSWTRTKKQQNLNY